VLGRRQRFTGEPDFAIMTAVPAMFLGGLMSVRKAFLHTTMLAGLVGASHLAARDAQANDALFAPNYAAVDGINAKVQGLGGSLANQGLYGVMGALAVPISGSWGVQIDGTIGSWNSNFIGSVGGHLFWRNPNVGLVGLYVNHAHYDQYGGVNLTQVAGEVEYYWNRWTVQGVAGVEFGNRAVGPGTTVTLTAPAGGVAGVAGTFAPVIDIKTRFFDKINVAYYPTDNWKTFIGHRYVGGLHALALGTEYALPIAQRRKITLFAEGRIGEKEFHGAWGGVKAYFGQNDKPLIARHRQDDPIEWEPDSIFGIMNNTNSNTQTSSQTIPCIPDGEGGCV
jgi:hypothetical protein